jgi:hypothetical protein
MNMIPLFRYRLLLLLIVSFNPGYSQPDTTSCNRISTNIKVSYNSSLIYPGARLGLESPLSRKFVTRSLNSGKEKSLIKEQFLTSMVSFYHHPGFHDNLYITAGWLKRRTKPKGFFNEFSPEIGYSRTFLGGATYTVSNSGEISKKKLAGYSYALISVGEGIGYDFKTKPFLVFSKINLLCMFPYNSTLYLRPAMEIGLIYKPADFLKMRVKSKTQK